MNGLKLGSVLFFIAFGLGVAQEAVPKLEKPVWATPSLGGTVNSARFSSNDALALSAGADGVIQIWNASNGAAVRTIQASNAGVYLAVFSKDGSRILSSGADDTTRVWNAKTGEKVLEIESGSASANFSPDASRIVMAAPNNKDVQVVSSKDGKVALTLKGHTDYIYEAEYSTDGSRIVTSSDDLTAKVWDAKTGKLIRSFKHPEVVLDATLFAENSRLLTGSEDGLVRVFDVASGKELAKLKADQSGVVGLAVSQDQTKLLSGGYDGIIRLWDAKTNKEIRSFKGHDRAVYSVSFGAKDQKIISSSRDGTARIWDAKNGKQLLSYNQHTFRTNSVTFSSDQKTILTTTSLREVRMYAANTGKEISKFNIGETLSSAAFSPDGSTFVTASDVHGDVWKTSDGSLVTSLNGHEGGMLTAVFSSDGKQILSVGYDSTARLWDSTTGEELLKLTHESDVLSAVFSFDQKQIISLDDAGTTYLWDAQTGKIIKQFAASNKAYYIDAAIQPVANNNALIMVNRIEGFGNWDLSGKPLFEERQDSVSKQGKVQILSSDASLAFIGLDTGAYVQELSTGKSLLELPDFDWKSNAVFSANNQQLVVTSPTSVRLFQLPTLSVKKLELPALNAAADPSKGLPTALEARVGQILALSSKGLLTGVQFLGLKRLIEDQKEPKELTDFLEQRLPEKDFLELVYAGFFERFNVPRGKP